MNTINSENQALACDLTAIPTDVREEHVVNAPQLFATAQEVQELKDGYAIRFANDPGKLMSVAKFIDNERLCCPFFHFAVELEPDGGPLWLRLTGAQGVKEMLQSILLEGRGDLTEIKTTIHTGDDTKLDAIIAATPFPVLTHIPKQDLSE
jgi:hypothetical protein